MNYQKSLRGFTLVEMVLYVGLCSILLISLSGLASYLLESRIRSQAINEVNQQGFQVMSLMTQTIRNGKSVEIPSVGTISPTLSITTADTLLNPTVFSLSSTTLTISEAGKQAISLTNSRVAVSSLSFQNVSSTSSPEKIIRISFVLSSLNTSGRGEYSFTKTFNGSAILR